MLRTKGSHNYGFQPSLFRDGVLASLVAIFTGAFEFLAAFLIWPATAIVGALIRWQWPASYYVLGFLVVAPVMLGALLWVLSKQHEKGMAIHITTVAGLVSGLLFYIDLWGWTKFAIFLMVCGVPLLCLTLAIRIVMQNKREKGLDHIFDQAGVPGANMKIHKHEGKTL